MGWTTENALLLVYRHPSANLELIEKNVYRPPSGLISQSSQGSVVIAGFAHEKTDSPFCKSGIWQIMSVLPVWRCRAKAGIHLTSSTGDILDEVAVRIDQI
jgi:hypothetical protein